jgi:hypothetical protein
MLSNLCRPVTTSHKLSNKDIVEDDLVKYERTCAGLFTSCSLQRRNLLVIYRLLIELDRIHTW